MSKFILDIPYDDIQTFNETGIMANICEGLDKLIEEESSYVILPSDKGYLTEITGEGELVGWEIRPTEDGKFVAEKGGSNYGY